MTIQKSYLFWRKFNNQNVGIGLNNPTQKVQMFWVILKLLLSMEIL